MNLLLEQFMNDAFAYFDKVLLIEFIKMLCFIIGLIVAFVLIFVPFLNQLKIKIWQTRGMLNMIPTKLLLNNDNLKEQFLKNQI